MFDGTAGGVLPICLASIAIGFLLSKNSSKWLAILLAVIAPVAIAYAWYWPANLVTSGWRQPEQGGWDLVATAYWSMFAIPTCLISLFVSRLLRKRSRGDS
jgi:formate hydrogenlyase subunit 3/multisubunit Na+/H+ antiporter MnhD subunit